jgi:hypothetical protein
MSTTAITTTTQTGTTIGSTPSTLQTVLQDLFELGIGAASIFVKNPATQATAVSIINILRTVFPNL